MLRQLGISPDACSVGKFRPATNQSIMTRSPLDVRRDSKVAFNRVDAPEHLRCAEDPVRRRPDAYVVRESACRLHDVDRDEWRTVERAPSEARGRNRGHRRCSTLTRWTPTCPSIPRPSCRRLRQSGPRRSQRQRGWLPTVRHRRRCRGGPRPCRTASDSGGLHPWYRRRSAPRVTLCEHSCRASACAFGLQSMVIE